MGVESVSEKLYFLLLFGGARSGLNGVEIDRGVVGFLFVALVYFAFGIWVSCKGLLIRRLAVHISHVLIWVGISCFLIALAHGMQWVFKSILQSFSGMEGSNVTISSHGRPA